MLSGVEVVEFEFEFEFEVVEVVEVGWWETVAIGSTTAGSSKEEKHVWRISI